MQAKRILKRSYAFVAGSIAAVFAVALLAIPSTSQAGKPWHSVAADFDYVGECLTAATNIDDPSNPGGISCYNKDLFVPASANVLRITWSTTGDTHGGAALRVGCVITPASTGVPRFCNDFVGGAAGSGFYITKQKIPAGTGAGNCNDGGGGDGDCHDNSVVQIWCTQIGNEVPDVFNIDLRLASGGLAGNVFVEASTFMVDSTKLGDNDCVQRDVVL